MKRFGLSILIFLFSSFKLAFSLSGQEVLDKVEENLTGYKDQTSLAQVVLGKIEGNKIEETRVMKIWNGGKNKRVVKFIQPSNVKDIGILVLSENEMYIYLPAYKKVRRIQGSMRDQNFQGTDFSYREIGSFNYSENYTSTVIKEDEKTIVLELVKKPSSDAPYSKLVMYVNKTEFLPEKIEMYDKGKLKKVLSIISRERKDRYWVLSHMKMEDLQKGHFTEIKIKEVTFDSGLESKGVFSQRFLQEPAK